MTLENDRDVYLREARRHETLARNFRKMASKIQKQIDDSEATHENPGE